MAGAAAIIAAGVPRHQTIATRKNKTLQDGHLNIGCFDNKRHARITHIIQKIRDHPAFQQTLIGFILLAGIQVGVGTYNITDEAFNQASDIVDSCILAVFVFEIAVKMGGEGRYPWRYFQDGWNRFDFAIVAVGLMPFSGGAVTALRLVRLLRVLKLLRALPKLRVLVMALMQSMSSIGYIGMLLGLLFYLYAVLGVSLFGSNDPVYFGTLHAALLTLCRCATLDNWVTVLRINAYGCDKYGYDGMMDLCTSPSGSFWIAVPYFVTLVVLSSMMILNLFIGVIVGAMIEAQNQLDAEDATAAAEILAQTPVDPNAPPKPSLDIEVVNEEEIEIEVEKRLYKVIRMMDSLALQVDGLMSEHRAIQHKHGLTGYVTTATRPASPGGSTRAA